MNRLVVTILAAAMPMAGCVGEKSHDGEHLPLGDPMPEFSVSGPDSGTVSTADLVGVRTLVVLFRTTCPDCSREMPGIEEAFKRVGAQDGMRFVAISKEGADVVSEYWRNAKLSMPWYLDPDGTVFESFGVKFVPTLYLFGSDGKVAYAAVETFDFSVDELVQLIEDIK